MEHTETNTKNPDSTQCVRVAVNIRPLITPELLHGCTNCITVPPGEPQVQIGTHAFTYDFVYGSTGSPSAAIFDDCVAPLVDALFHGYNATVLAYGQTGSGKTYTMGTNYSGEDNAGGIIPQVMRTIFNRVRDIKDESSELLIRVSFIEIFKEEVYDLLDPNSSKGELAGNAKFAGPARVPIQIRETYSGGITLAGVTEPEVKTKEEMSSYLSRGSMSRATGSTNMNSQSSRSHAIFTITLEQKNGDDVLCAKLHLVDLAGSERAKRTGADGMRLKEGIHINKGLLTLGNVISALGDERKRKEGGHVPYRDSKLTRLLQDSLGGNSKTVMIACVSPADTNVEETLNTLKYANRARNIQNKAIINRDPMGAQQQRLQSRIDQLEAELLCFKGLGGGSSEEIQILKHKVSLLEASNAELQRELHARGQICESLKQRACDAQVEKDQLMMKIEAARNGKSWDEIDSSSSQDCDLVKSYVSKIHDLEEELVRLKNSNVKSSNFHDWVDSDDLEFQSKNGLFAGGNEYSSDCDVKPVGITDDVEPVDVREKELEHSSAQEKLDRELKELDKKLEQKEAEMKLVNNASVLKQHYEKKLLELEHEKKYLQREIEELKSISGDSTHKLKEEYLQKLNALESQVSELKKKQDAQAHLLRQKQKGDEAAKKLQDEIQRIKSQKVQLQHKIKQESEQFRLWKASREKEVLQLKKEGRKNEYERHKLLALNQRTKMVLQRKTEEASLATKRLKELLESRKASSRETGISGPGIQALMKAIEHELEVTVRVHEVRSEYQRQMDLNKVATLSILTTAMGSRPELVAPPEILYDDDTSRKYTSNSRNIEIQTSMTERALELLNLPKDSVPKLLLDIGCGSGLSGETITENGHHWIGLDISASMLNIALEREVEGDLLLGDMGQGLGLRFGVFDGAIGISTIQWLCNADKSSHNPHLRLKAFFTSLYRCLTNGSRAVFQVYPENDDQRKLISDAAMAVGFGGGLLVDYPDSPKRRKEFLYLTCGYKELLPKGKTEEDDSESEENETVYVSDRHRPWKMQKNSMREKGREWIKRKKEQRRRRGNDVPGKRVPPDTKYTGRKRKDRF